MNIDFIKFFLYRIMKFLSVSIVIFLLVSCNNDEKELIKSARSGNLASKLGAIEKLASSNNKKAISAIIEGLSHRNSLVRRTAAKALRNKDLSVAWPLIHSLRDSDSRVRIQAVKSLFSLPSADFIYFALINSLKDPSGEVRNIIFKGLIEKGFTLSDILILKSWKLRLNAFESVISPHADDRAAGFKLLGRLGKIEDLPFMINEMTSRDPFIFHNAIESLATIDSPIILNVILSALPSQSRNNAILLFLKKNKYPLGKLLIKKVLSSGIDNDLIVKTIAPENLKSFPCSLLSFLKSPKSIQKFRITECSSEKLSLSTRIIYNSTKTGLSENLVKLIKSETDSLSADGFYFALKTKSLRSFLLTWMEKQWTKFLFTYEKWIPDSTWEKLSILGSNDIKPKKKSLNPREKFFSTFRKKINVNFEHELLPPDFDIKLFSARIAAFKKISAGVPFLLKVLKEGPDYLKVAALKALVPATKESTLPTAIVDASKNENDNVKVQAIRTIAQYNNMMTLLSFYNIPNPVIRDIIYSAIERTGDDKGISLAFKTFKKSPTARIAKLLGNLRVIKAKPEFISLLKADTPLELSKERVEILKALHQIAPSDPNVIEIIHRDLLHPSPIVRCGALSLIKNEKIIEAYRRFDPSSKVRTCSSKVK